MSFSGLKTALLRARDGALDAQGRLSASDRADLCAGFQAAVADVPERRSAAGVHERRHRARHPLAVRVRVRQRVYALGGGADGALQERDELARAVVAAADVVDGTNYTYGSTPSCSTDTGLTTCDTTFSAIDFRDAGGAVSDFEGGDQYLHGRRIVAGSSALLPPVRELLAEVHREPERFAPGASMSGPIALRAEST